MTDRDDFLAWVETTLYEAELALHNGDAAPRRALWSRNEPVSCGPGPRGREAERPRVKLSSRDELLATTRAVADRGRQTFAGSSILAGAPVWRLAHSSA
jgi:hypothetical protein